MNVGTGRVTRRALAIALLCSQALLACATPRAELPTPVPEPQRELRAGDILRIEVWRQPEYSGEIRIGSDGALVHPLYRELRLAGLSEREATERITDFLSVYLQDPRLVVEPLYGVSVAGEVRAPSIYYAPRGTTVAEAIALAGGPTPRARLNEIILTRAGVGYVLQLGREVTTFGDIAVVSGDQILLDEQSQFSVWRDIVAPVGTLASLVVALIRISEKTGN